MISTGLRVGSIIKDEQNSVHLSKSRKSINAVSKKLRMRTVESLNALITRRETILVQRSAVAVPSQVDCARCAEMHFLAVSTAGRSLLVFLPTEETSPRTSIAAFACVLFQIAQRPS